jgi:hypothetical protein
MYEGSTEEHRYVSSLSKEKSAFESLIKSKEHMVISLPDDPIDLQHEMDQDSKHTTISMDTRTIHRSNQQKNKEPRRIIVDVREFRSLLPSMLYSAKFEILPRTLEVADYVLSSDICVERKGKKEGRVRILGNNDDYNEDDVVVDGDGDDDDDDDDHHVDDGDNNNDNDDYVGYLLCTIFIVSLYCCYYY